MKNCAYCGKEFDVIYPDIWAYKKGWPEHSVFFCSWKCLRADESREEDYKIVKQLTNKEITKAAEIALAGECPYEYMKTIGVKNVYTSWRSIRNRAKKIDPEKYADLPETFGNKTAEEVPEAKTEAEAEKMVQEYFADTEKQKITKAINYDGFDVCCIRNYAFGELYRDKTEDGYIEWTTPNGQKVTLDKQGWQKFAKDLPRALQVLGVDV